MPQGDNHVPVDVSEFTDMTARGATAEERATAIRRRYPSTATLRWEVAFDHNPDLLGAILRDILKQARAEPGRHGPRPGLDRTRDMPDLDRMLGQDPARHPYCLLPFRDAFTLLLGSRSVRHAATKLGMTPSRVYRLKAGLGAPPSTAEMEHIAGRFGHHPSFFAEYRVWAIHTSVIEELGRHPETGIAAYERLWQRATPPGAAAG